MDVRPRSARSAPAGTDATVPPGRRSRIDAHRGHRAPARGGGKPLRQPRRQSRCRPAGCGAATRSKSSTAPSRRCLSHGIVVTAADARLELLAHLGHELLVVAAVDVVEHQHRAAQQVIASCARPASRSSSRRPQRRRSSSSPTMTSASTDAEHTLHHPMFDVVTAVDQARADRSAACGRACR